MPIKRKKIQITFKQERSYGIIISAHVITQRVRSSHWRVTADDDMYVLVVIVLD